MLERYPFEEPPGFAFGAIQSEVNPSKCIDTLGAKREQPVGLYPCKKPLTNPGWHQTFKWLWIPFRIDLLNFLKLFFSADFEFIVTSPSKTPETSASISIMEKFSYFLASINRRINISDMIQKLVRFTVAERAIISALTRTRAMTKSTIQIVMQQRRHKGGYLVWRTWLCSAIGRTLVSPSKILKRGETLDLTMWMRTVTLRLLRLKMKFWEKMKINLNFKIHLSCVIFFINLI